MIVALDLSRLLSRAGRMPTGIDRVELAYAQYLLRSGTDTCFAALSPFGRLGLLPQRGAEAFIRRVAAMWRGAPAWIGAGARLALLARRLRLNALAGGERALHRRLTAGGGPSVYLLVSHHHLERRRLLLRLKRRASAKIVCIVHDLIPVEYPEYAKPGQAAAHRRRIESAVRVADALIVNSTATRLALLPHLEAAGRRPEIVVAPFAVDLPAVGKDAAPPPDRPFFVYLGTIEARKNHLMLLNVWRRLAEEHGDGAPLLVLIGQRGWEVENAVDMLDRCPRLRGVVIEHGPKADGDMVRLVKEARALLLPSFAEGFGFPVIEALELGVPVLCSDIAALRETGGDVPEYLDPLDALGWHRAILDYAAPQSPRRDAQLRRLSRWRAPSWDEHFARVEHLFRPAGNGAAEAAHEPAARGPDLVHAE